MKKSNKIASALLFVGLTLFTGVAQSDTTIVPQASSPEACGASRQNRENCNNWYSMVENPTPDACASGRQNREECRRWYQAGEKEVKPPPTSFKIRGVNFDFNKSTIRSSSYAILDETLKALHQQKDPNIVVIGHTDSIGSDSYNQRLSERRAAAVKDYFVSKGYAASKIRTEGKGESQPVASNKTDEGREQNRRVEIRIQ